jgi:hypothetical protein
MAQVDKVNFIHVVFWFLILFTYLYSTLYVYFLIPLQIYAHVLSFTADVIL